MFTLKRPPGYIPSMRQLAWFAQAPGRHRPTLYRTLRARARSWWARKVLKTIKELSNTLSDLRASAARVRRKRPALVPEPLNVPPVPVPTTPAVAPTPKFLRTWRAPRRHRAGNRSIAPRQAAPVRLPRRLRKALTKTYAYARRGQHLVHRHCAPGYNGLRALPVWIIE